jgi:hypothetical protein
MDRYSCALAVYWTILKMTNSAGRTGATPISQMRRPFRGERLATYFRSTPATHTSAVRSLRVK